MYAPMGEVLRLIAADSHELSAYRADPEGVPRGGIVLVQEIFGVNAHIREVADRFASEGYAVIAPALFDRIERGVELDYSEETTAKGRALRGELGWEAPLKDIQAALKTLRPAGKVAVIGFCWGGSLAWLAACRLKADGAVCYYGAQIRDFTHEPPACPVLMHFGENDPLIPPAAVAEIAAAHPDIPIFTYPAGHGFNCDRRGDFHAPSAALAWDRTRAFLSKQIG